MGSSTVLMIRLVVVVALAVGGYQRTATYEREHGMTPWDLPKGVWSFLWALGLLPGAILWALAKRTTKPLQVQPQAPVQNYGGTQFGGTQFGGTQFGGGGAYAPAPGTQGAGAPARSFDPAAANLSGASVFAPAAPTSPQAQLPALPPATPAAPPASWPPPQGPPIS